MKCTKNSVITINGSVAYAARCPCVSLPPLPLQMPVSDTFVSRSTNMRGANMSDRTCRVTRQTSSTAFFAAASPKNPVRLARRFLCSTCHYGGRGTGAGHKHQRVHARVVKRWGGKWGLRRLTMHRRRSAFGQTLWKALRSTSLSSEKI